MESKTAKDSESINSNQRVNSSQKRERGLQIEGYSLEGISIAGHETCIIVPTLNLAFDIGKCPQRAISQQFLFISHGHMDHIGGLPMYVATRSLYRMKPPTIIVPKVIKESVEKLFEAHRAMDHSELNHTLIGLDVEEEFYLRKDLKVRAFKTYHVIPSQGYIVYSIKQKLKQEYVGLPGDEIKKLKLSGVEITYTTTAPEIAFTGDTMSDFIKDPKNVDVLRAKILIMESTYVEDKTTADNAREYGHTHLDEIINFADMFQNKAILLIHFSARYQLDVIQEAISAIPPPLAGHNYSHISKKRKKKKMESEKRKRSKNNNNMVQKLYDTCKQVFANGKAGYVPPPHDIQRLTSLLDSLEPKDIKFTAPSLEVSCTSPGTKETPLVTYIKLHECNKFSIGMFCLPPSGVIPLHNHPGMTVFCKLLGGTIHKKSYDWVKNHDHHQFSNYSSFTDNGQHESRMRLAKVHVDGVFTAPCNASVLFPESGGNMHCFKALTPCLLLDVLGPPYSEAEGRQCTYYQQYTYDHIRFSDVKEMEVKENETRSYAWLEERNDEKFVVLGGTYDGPTIKK